MYYAASMQYAARDAEIKHINQALHRLGYPAWALNKSKLNAQKPKNNSNTNNRERSVGYVVVPYVKGISESFKELLEKHGVNVYFRGGVTIRSQLMRPKDPDDNMKKSGVVYRIKCGRCNDSYIGETGQNFGDRLKQHVKNVNSPLNIHHKESGHPLPNEDNIDIVTREGHKFSRQIKESLFIQANSPVLNRNIGKHELPAVYNSLIAGCNELKVKPK